MLSCEFDKGKKVKERIVKFTSELRDATTG